MVQPRTLVKIADNSGGKVGRVFKVLGSTGKRYAEIGDIVALSVQSAEPRKDVSKNDVVHGIVVRQRKPYRRKDGSYVRFDDNAVVLVNQSSGEVPANRLFGPIPRELGDSQFPQITSLASEIV
jgi:large subunit ribosomal protein L14